MTPKFIQIHTLTSWAGALLNRDEFGMGKRLPYGGAVRGRVSSQCKKRHWRTADDDRSILSLGHEVGGAGVRSRETVEYRVRDVLLKRFPAEAQPIVDVVCDALVERVYGKLGVGKVASRQALLLGQAEIDWMLDEAEALVKASSDVDRAKEETKAWLKDQDKNLSRLSLNAAMPGGLDAALFGRMVTSDRAANTDAAVMVNHSITVHAEQSELDYFTVVDDLSPSSAGLFDAEVNSGLYYGYVVIDVAQLVANITGNPRSEWNGVVDRRLAGRVSENLVHLIAKVTPGAKKGSTAPFSRASLVLVEAGHGQPTTLDGAFMEPLPLVDRSGLAIGRRASDAMAARLRSFDDMYGDAPKRKHAAVDGFEIDSVERASLPDLAGWVAKIVEDAEA